MRRRTKRIFLVLLGAAAALAVFGLVRWKAIIDGANMPHSEPFRIAGNLYYVGTVDETAFLLTGPEGHVLIDGGFPATAPRIMESIATLGFDIGDVKVLLNSHAHFGHVGGLAALQEASGAELWISEGDADVIASSGSLLEPALDELGLTVVRADSIGEPGMITTQILEYIRKSRLAVADLSYLNPNVFYEVALRHACRLPTVQIIRKSDRLPFDVNRVRSLVIDTTDIFSLVPRIPTYRSEIATLARKALEDPESVGNPITVFYPAFFSE